MNAFGGLDPETSVSAAYELVGQAAEKDDAARQHFEILETPNNVAKALYSIGFVGIKHQTSGVFNFCHDGRFQDRMFEPRDKMLVHPCYWMALNLTRDALAQTASEEIFDDYVITVISETPAIRRTQLGKMMSDLELMPTGEDGARKFEEWSLKAIQIIFAGKLANAVLHPNQDATQRRDIVATNVAEQGFWHRVYDDYKSRQVIFEVKNYRVVGRDEYRQMLSYLQAHTESSDS